MSTKFCKSAVLGPSQLHGINLRCSDLSPCLLASGLQHLSQVQKGFSSSCNYPHPKMYSELVNTISKLQAFLNGLPNDKGEVPRLFVDLEGNDLSRTGTLSLVNVLVEREDKVYLIDVTELQYEAFDTAGEQGRTLRGILESTEIDKVFFDIRNDSDALYSLYGVDVNGVEDLQLLELASRRFSRRCVNGLAKCIEQDSTIAQDEKNQWRKAKHQGRQLFNPQLGGDFTVFDRRPLSADIIHYCIQDVMFMPHLREMYRGKLHDAWWTKIAEETKARIALSQSTSFNGKGRHMAMAPTGWAQWEPTPSERLSRRLLEPAVYHEEDDQPVVQPS